MKESKLPTRKDCFELIEEYRVPRHILRHSETVAGLAVFLAERLKEKSITVDVELVERAALLHDIVRVCDFNDMDYSKFDGGVSEQDKEKWEQIRERFRDISHEHAAYEILKDRFPQVALTIKRHRYMGMLDENERARTWEEKLLFYADLRVEHTQIVPLKERLEKGHKRNAHLHGGAEQCRINTAKVDPLVYRLEEELFGILALEPDEITDGFIESYSKKSAKE